MHLLDLTHWLLGPCRCIRAVAHPVLGHAGEDNARTAARAATCARRAVGDAARQLDEWKNCFSLEVYCRTAKLHVEGLVRSYGAQTRRIFRGRPVLGPPDLEQMVLETTSIARGSWSGNNFPNGDIPTDRFRRRVLGGPRRRARCVGAIVEAAYARTGWVP
jgi:hypothetical protein